MDQRRVTNALLFVIAVCLVLIVAHLYGLSLTPPVEAEQTARPQPVELVYRGADDTFHPLADKDGHISMRSQRP